MDFSKYKKEPLLWKCAFFLLSFLYLGIYHQDVLYHIGWKSYFVDNEPFRELTVHQSCGWLFYISLYLNQIFFYPKTAAFVISLILTLLVVAVEKCSRCEWNLLNYLPSVFLLLLFGRAGMAIFSPFQMGMFWALILGTCWTVGMYALHRRYDNTYLTYALLAVSLLLVPLWGIFSALTMLVISFDELLKRNYICLVVSIVAFPLALYCSGYVMYDEDYVHALYTPFASPFYKDIFLCSVFLALSLMGLPFYHLVNRWAKLTDWRSQILSVAFLSLIAFFGSYREANYRALIKLVRMSDSMQWKEMLQYATSINHPTRGVNAYRIIAANARGQLNKRIFDVQLPLSASQSPYTMEAAVYLSDEFLHASFLAMAQSTAMDEWIEIGENYRTLKRFVVIALLRGEDDLAMRYIRIMKDAPVLRSTAEELEQYVENKELFFEKYPIYRQIVENRLEEDHPQLIHNHLSSFYLWYDHLTGVNIERRLLANLYQRRVDAAVNEYILFRRSGWSAPVPEWFSEAVVIKSIREGNFYAVQQLKIAPMLVQKVQACFSDFSKFRGDQMMEAGEKLYPKYRGMYCYYYLLNNYKFNDSVPQER